MITKNPKHIPNSIFLIITLVGLFLLANSSHTPPTPTFKAHLSGWYPTEQTKLLAMLKNLDTHAQQQCSATITNPIRAIITPHAGYTYSGDVAASVYRLL